MLNRKVLFEKTYCAHCVLLWFKKTHHGELRETQRIREELCETL